MKRNIFFKTVYFLAAAVVIVNLVLSVKSYLFASIDNLPEGKLEYTSESPSGNKKINIYLVENSLGTGIRGELVKKSGKTQNIFWQTDLRSANIVWENENTITLNGVPLSATGKTVYDCRRGTALFRDGALMEDVFEDND